MIIILWLIDDTTILPLLLIIQSCGILLAIMLYNRLPCDLMLIGNQCFRFFMLYLSIRAFILLRWSRREYLSYPLGDVVLRPNQLDIMFFKRLLILIWEGRGLGARDWGFDIKLDVWLQRRMVQLLSWKGLNSLETWHCCMGRRRRLILHLGGFVLVAALNVFFWWFTDLNDWFRIEDNGRASLTWYLRDWVCTVNLERTHLAWRIDFQGNFSLTHFVGLLL